MSIVDSDSTSRAVIDGSKVIFQLSREDKILFVHPSRLLAMTEGVIVTRVSVFKTRLHHASSTPQVVIIDSSTVSSYYPISLISNPVVYLATIWSYVMVGDVAVSKVVMGNFPSLQANKFVLLPSGEGETSNGGRGGAQNAHTPSQNLSGNSISPSGNLTAPMPSKVSANEVDDAPTNDKQSGEDSAPLLRYRRCVSPEENSERSFIAKNCILIPCDGSLVRCQLRMGEKLFLASGTLVAWTHGISITTKRVCCWKIIVFVQGFRQGTVWIHNPHGGKPSKPHVTVVAS